MVASPLSLTMNNGRKERNAMNVDEIGYLLTLKLKGRRVAKGYESPRLYCKIQN